MTSRSPEEARSRTSGGHRRRWMWTTMATDPAADLLDREGTIERLRSSLATVEWAVRLIPEGWSHRSPGGTLSPEEGAWSAAMNLAHLAVYEETFPGPVIEDLLAGGNGLGNVSSLDESTFEARAMALASEPMVTILGRLQQARGRQIELAGEFDPAEFVRPVTSAWGSSGMGPRRWSAARVLAKTVQHTFEHGSSILTVAVFAPQQLVED